MTGRRMFAQAIIATDTFFRLPITARELYIYLALFADDEGILCNPATVMRMCGASSADLDALIATGYVILFCSGMIAITHWLVHNNIKRQLRRKSVHTAERALLRVDPVSKVYILIDDDAQDIGITLDQIDDKAEADTDKGAYGLHHNVRLTAAEYTALQSEYPLDYGTKIEHLSEYMHKTGKTYSDHLAVIRRWAAADAAQDRSSNPFVRLAGV